MSAGQSYGQSLPDQVDRIARLSDAQLELLSDVRELYRSRITLEKDYAAKLQILATKAAEKKIRKISALVLGDEPTKAWGEDVIKQNTLNQAYSQLISSFTDSAQDHLNLADALNVQVVDTLKTAEKKNEEAKEKEVKFFQKLLGDRDRVYAERTKSKQKYDEECLEVATYRQKQDRAQDDKHAGRAAKQYEQQQIDMHNSKNAYLISIQIANNIKAKFYREDIPALENQYQRLQTDLLNKTVKILAHAQALTATHFEKLKDRAVSVETALCRVDPSKDQDLFINYNIRNFSAPTDWIFEPCSSHYDTPEMVLEPAPKVVLQNKLVRCRGKLAELQPILAAKRKNAEQLAKLVVAYSGDHSLGNADDVITNFLDTSHDLTAHATSECILVAEIETIDGALEGDEGEQQPHLFKSASFSIPTHCGYCAASIWGLSKQGKTCKSCGMSVHAKCELKVPATCTSRVSDPSRVPSISKMSRASTIASKAASNTSTPSSFVRMGQTATIEETHASARVMFEFEATSPFELSVAEGTTVTIVEEDDGSGWVKVSDDSGGKGLVPASYLEVPALRSSAPPPYTESGQCVRGVYDYEATGDDELGVKNGELIKLTPGPNGGQNYAEGWWEGVDARGKKGIFPSNYVTLA